MFHNVNASLAELSLKVLTVPPAKIVKLDQNKDKLHKLEKSFKSFLAANPKFDVNAKTAGGYSLVYYAARTGNIALFNILKENGARLDDTYDGLTLRDIIKQQIVNITIDDKVKPISSNSPMMEIKKYLEVMDKILEGSGIKYNETALLSYREKISDYIDSHKQSWITNPMRKFAYDHRDNGHCFGVAHMGAQALLLEERDDDQELIHLFHFSARVNKLKHSLKYNVNIHDNLVMLKHKRTLWVEIVKKNNPELAKDSVKINAMVDDKLTLIEKQLLEIEPFLDGIEVFQQIEKHAEVTPHQITRNIVAGFELVPSLLLEKQGGAVAVDHFAYRGNLIELVQLLHKIERLAKDNHYQAPIVLTLMDERHCICIAYDPVIANKKDGGPSKAWIDIDANNPDEILKKFNAEEIAALAKKQVFISKSHLQSYNNPDAILGIDVTILSTASRAIEIKDKIITPLHVKPKKSLSSMLFSSFSDQEKKAKAFEKEFLKINKEHLKIEKEHLAQKVDQYQKSQSKASTTTNSNISTTLPTAKKK